MMQVARILALVLGLAVFAPAAMADPAPLPQSQVGPVTRMTLPRFVSLKAEANARRGPGIDHRVDWILKRRGMPLQVVAEFDNWRKVVDADGTGGWVHYTLLRGARTIIVRAPRASILEEPRPEARPVAIAEQGVIADLEGCGPDWCRIEADGYEGWVQKADIWGAGAGEIFD
ncbi:MAG TPA: SH3 domain-containing protein [Paracoccaceae bacterium]|nr:SH3 domain-containing protein [Paracoccaceae bacterium]